MRATEEFKKPFYIANATLKNGNTKIHKIIRQQVDPLDPTPLNKYELQNYAYYGFDDKWLRPKMWRIFLFYFSENKFRSELYYKERRNAYKEYKQQSIEAKTKDPCIMKIIDDDLDRTTLFPEITEEAVSCKFLDSKFVDQQECMTHRELLKEILLVFKVMNPAIEYVQGMNMLIIIIYYVFAKYDNPQTIETDTFYCFLNLVTEFSEYFVEKMDDQFCGIQQKLNTVIDILKEFDIDLYRNMKSKKLTNNIFHFRWILLSFAQEFPIEDVIWLWDKFLSDSTRFELVLYCAAAKILLLKSKIMTSDFAQAMLVLQDNSEVDAKSMFYKADEMRRSTYKTLPW